MKAVSESFVCTYVCFDPGNILGHSFFTYTADVVKVGIRDYSLAIVYNNNIGNSNG